MNSLVEKYIDRVLLYANRPEAESENLRKELRDHLLQKIDDLAAEGTPREEAIIEALQKHGQPSAIGYRLRGGFPWLDIRTRGTARGVIAIGPRAIGIFAFGGVAMGVAAIGGVSIGLVSLGGLALGLLVWAGLGIGGITFAGLAVGAVAMGGLAVGLVAKGGLAAGAWTAAHGPSAVSYSYFSAANVPPALKSLSALFAVPNFMEAHMLYILPFYLLMIGVLVSLQIHEQRRLSARCDDWLIDG